MSFSLMLDEWFTVSKFSWNFEQIKLNKMNMCYMCTSKTAKLCVVSLSKFTFIKWQFFKIPFFVILLNFLFPLNYAFNNEAVC